MTEQEKIADRVRKMVAKAGSTNSHDEAMMIMAKVESMLQEHGMTMLQAHTLDRDDPVARADGAIVLPKGLGYAPSLACAIGDYYGAYGVVTWKNDERVVTFFGRESAVQTVCVMFHYLLKEINRLAGVGHKAGKFRTKTVGMTAVGNALVIRIGEINRANEKRTAGTANALVPYDVIDQMAKAAFPDLKIKKRTMLVGAAAKALAGQISLSQQVGGGQKLAIGR